MNVKLKLLLYTGAVARGGFYCCTFGKEPQGADSSEGVGIVQISRLQDFQHEGFDEQKARRGGMEQWHQ